MATMLIRYQSALGPSSRHHLKRSRGPMNAFGQGCLRPCVYFCENAGDRLLCQAFIVKDVSHRDAMSAVFVVTCSAIEVIC